MKTQELKPNFEVFAVFTLTAEEMSAVRGGSQDGEPKNIPPTPPVKL